MESSFYLDLLSGSRIGLETKAVKVPITEGASGNLKKTKHFRNFQFCTLALKYEHPVC